MRFNHLNVPDQWRHYWTKYPEGYTILEALISWVSQVDDMVDNQNKLNNNVENFRVELDDFISRFDPKLQTTVTNILSEWQSSGFLDVIISEALQTEIDIVSTQVAERVESIAMPEKRGVKTNRPKLVIVKESNNEIMVVQYNGSKYVVYTLNSAPGTTTESIGSNWDLIRIKKVIMANNAYVAKKNYNADSVVGTVDTLYTPSHRNIFENYMVPSHPDEIAADFLSSTGDGYGIPVHGLVRANAVSSVSYDVRIGSGRKCNVVLFGSENSSPSVDILVNGEVIKTVDTSKLAIGSNLTFKVIEFEIPSRVNFATPVNVTIRNNNTENKKAYFGGLNFMYLKDYEGEDIDFYKVFTTNQEWINHSGASDYAIFDHDLQKWCGSYHGGEIAISQRMTFASGTEWVAPNDYQNGRYAMRNKSSVPTGWYVLPSFKIQQLTNINNKGKMLSIFDFDVDGTMQMDFSFYDGSIIAENFFTALTSTSADMNFVRYPTYEPLPTDQINVHLKGREGSVIQYNSNKGLSLGIRYTLFGGRFNPPDKQFGWIYNHPTIYKKFYYGLVQDNTDGVLVNNLQFRKALDFLSE